MTKTFLTKLLCLVFAICFVFVGCTDKDVASSADISDDLLSKSLDSVSKNQEKFIAMDFDNLSLSANAEIVIGDGFYDLMNKVGDMPGTGNMFKQFGISSVKVHADLDRNDDVFDVSLDGMVNGSKIVSGDVIIDLDDEMLYLDVPAISSQTAHEDISYVLSEADFDYAWDNFANSYESMVDFNESVNGILTDDELFAIVEDYLDCGLEEFGAPETGTKSISIENISQKVNYKKYTINERGAIGFAKAVVTKLKNDKNIRSKFIQLYPVFVDYLEETIGYEYEMVYAELPSAEELYDEEFLPLLEEAVEELENYDFEDSDEEVYFEQYFADDAFVGFSFAIPDGSVIKMYSVENGTDVAATLYFEDAESSECTEISLIGKVYNGVFNGELKLYGVSNSYELDYDIYEVVSTSSDYNFSIGIENVDLKKMEQGIINGTLVFDTDDFEGFESEEFPDGFVMKISLETDGYFNGKFAVSMETDEGLVLSYKFDVSIDDDAKEVKIPTNSVSLERWQLKDDEEILRYFIGKLKEAGVNESILQMAESSL